MLAEANPTAVKLEVPDQSELLFLSHMGSLFEGGKRSYKVPKVDPEAQKRDEKLKREARRNGFGELSFHEFADAAKDILPRCKTAKQKKEYYLAFVHEYNDARTFRIDGGWVIGLEDYRPLFEEYAKELSVVRGKPQTINAEMCRELGQFDRAIEICHRLLDAGTDVEAVRQILVHAEAHDPDVFELQFEEKEQ